MHSKMTSSGWVCQRQARRLGTARSACFQTCGVRKEPRHCKNEWGGAAAGGGRSVERFMSRCSAAGRGLVTATMMAENGSFSCAAWPRQLRHGITGTGRHTKNYSLTTAAFVNDIEPYGDALRK